MNNFGNQNLIHYGKQITYLSVIAIFTVLLGVRNLCCLEAWYFGLWCFFW